MLFEYSKTVCYNSVGKGSRMSWLCKFYGRILELLCNVVLQCCGYFQIYSRANLGLGKDLNLIKILCMLVLLRIMKTGCASGLLSPFFKKKNKSSLFTIKHYKVHCKPCVCECYWGCIESSMDQFVWNLISTGNLFPMKVTLSYPEQHNYSTA